MTPSSPSPSALTDRAGPVKQGEELDVAAVDRWLKQRLPALEGSPEVTQFSGGASNWTYRLRYPGRDLILRRPPAGIRAESAHDMKREHDVQKALEPCFPYVPAMIGLCRDESVLGADFYVMERLEGIIPRANLPKGLSLSRDRARALCCNVLDKLTELHQVDPRAAGLESLGKGEGYVRRQIEGWSRRYQNARTWNVPSFRYVRDYLQANLPEDVATCVIHNDFRFDNVVLDPGDPTRVVGILDWEMATLGDPLMDLGNSLAYWVQADDDIVMKAVRRQPTHLPGMLRREEVVERYLDRMGFKPETWTFYEVYGLFRLAAIVQQIYYRYHHKQTRNKAFKNFWIFVNYLNLRCRRAIKNAKA